MTTDVQICNAALARIGDQADITSLTDGSVQASYCNTFYPIARDALLAKYPWTYSGTSPASFPPLFTEALILLLASYLAGPIIKGDVGVAAEKALLELSSGAIQVAIEEDIAHRNLGTPTVDIQICNLALGKIGDGTRVTSLIDNSRQARYCSTFYPLARNAILDTHTWSFATKEVALTVTTNTTTQWAYAYSLPADFMGIIDLRDPSYSDQLQSPNTQSYNLQSGIIYSNIPNAVLIYSSTTATDPTLFQPLFIEALAVLLASYLAGPVITGTNGVNVAQALKQEYGIALRAAIHSDCAYRKVTPTHQPESILARA